MFHCYCMKFIWVPQRILREYGRNREIDGLFFSNKVYFHIDISSDFFLPLCINGIACRHVKFWFPMVVSILPIPFSSFGSIK